MNKKDKVYLIIGIGIAVVAFILGVLLKSPSVAIITFATLGFLNVYWYLKNIKHYDSRLTKYIKVEAYALGLCYLSFGISYALNIYYTDSGIKTNEVKLYLTLLPIILLIIFSTAVFVRLRANKKLNVK